ncbi:peroxiredoxin [Adhaeribacter aquaticus]|uniref:peroxiredoxin n=1 Tax=Adhaeribacter aquaticus TaxID=299567 RepID=UPI00041C1FBB|nr:peroxiredoxin [Adhaeribacter aquaticus]
MLAVGDNAPDFELLKPDKTPFRLSEVLKSKKVVLYFYPKDDTRGCTAEACSFRDLYQVFQEQGAEVVGISSDDTESHHKFSSKYNLPFVLLSDSTRKVRKLYQVPKTLALIPGRVTYVIDQSGIVRYAFNSLMKPLEHVSGALEVLKTI